LTARVQQKFKVQGFTGDGLASVCWLPLAAVSFIQLGWQQFYLEFIRDIATHVRIILVLPILIFARQSLNNEFNKMISIFHETKIVDHDNAEGFQKVMDWLMKWRNSRVVDVLLILLVYSSFYVHESGIINKSDSYVPWLLYENKITAAGWWYFCLACPLPSCCCTGGCLPFFSGSFFCVKSQALIYTFLRFIPMAWEVLAF
jgi:hypothetical protein